MGKPKLPTYGTTTNSGGNTGGASGNFPQGATAMSIIENLGVSSSDVGQYVNVTTGALTSAGADLIDYFYMTPPERLQLQQQMANAGYMKAVDITGDMTSTSTDAYKQLITGAASQGISVQDYINQLSQAGLGPIQQQLGLEAQQAETEAAKPITYKPENDTTLAQALSSAVDQTLGYTPANMTQLTNQFIAQIHAQDYAQAAEGHTGAEQEISQIHSQESALNKLGPDGVDTVIQAYANAVHGEGNRVGTPTGQITQLGQSTNPLTAPFTTATAPATRVNAPGTGNPLMPFQGGVEGPNQQVPAGEAQRLKDIATNAGGGIEFNGRVVAGSARPAAGLVSAITGPQPDVNAAPGSRGTSTTTVQSTTAPTQATVPISNGGLYALTPAQWKKAITLLPASMKKLAKPTAGASPVLVQQAAFSSLMLDTYNKTGSWSTTIEQIAGGSPFGKAKGKNLAPFATSVANEVNNRVANLGNQANNPLVITEPTAPDYQAEALAAAKAADPVGYYAANYASWGDELSKMLYGSPLSTIQSTADTFTGPVGGATSAVEGASTAGTAPTPTPTAAGAK